MECNKARCVAVGAWREASGEQMGHFRSGAVSLNRRKRSALVIIASAPNDEGVANSGELPLHGHHRG
jgi:hypothetical protein